MYDTSITLVVVVLNGLLVARFWASGMKLRLTSKEMLDALWHTQKYLAVLFTTPGLYCVLCELQQFFPDIAHWLDALKNCVCAYSLYVFLRVLLSTAGQTLEEVLQILDQQPYEQTEGNWTDQGVLFRRAYKWCIVFALAKPLLSLLFALAFQIQGVVPQEANVLNSIITLGVALPLAYYTHFLTRLLTPITKLPNPRRKILLVFPVIPLLGIEDDFFQVAAYLGWFGGSTDPEYAHWRGEDIFARVVSIQMLIVSLLYWRETFWSREDLSAVFEENETLLTKGLAEGGVDGDGAEWNEESPPIEAPVMGVPQSMDLDALAGELGLDLDLDTGMDEETGDAMGLFDDLANLETGGLGGQGARPLSGEVQLEMASFGDPLIGGGNQGLDIFKDMT